MKKKDSRKGQIYIVKNTVNDKVYIGQTIEGYKRRWIGHKSESKTVNKPFYAAIRKYGTESFYVELLEDNIEREKLDEVEIKYIKEYNCVFPNGYNISYGGQAYRTEEELKQMSERFSGENNPMYGRCGKLNPFYGKKHTEEVIEGYRQNNRKYYQNLSDKEKRAINIKLDRAREKMIKMYGGGFKGWNHTDEAKKKISEAQIGKVTPEKTRKLMSKNSPRKQKVAMLTTSGDFIKEFESMKIACVYLKENNIAKNPKSSEISSVCTKSRKTAYGYIWAYYDSYLKGDFNIVLKPKSKPRPVKCINTGKEYKSANQAYIDTGCTANGIISCCNGKYSYASDRDGNKLKWEYVNKNG